jgi:hypothetical protein
MMAGKRESELVELHGDAIRHKCYGRQFYSKTGPKHRLGKTSVCIVVLQAAKTEVRNPGQNAVVYALEFRKKKR